MTTLYDSAAHAPESGSPLPRRSSALGWTSVAFSAALMVVSVLSVDSRQVIERLEATDARFLFAFFAVYVAQILLFGLRWSTISRALRVPLGWRRASAEYSLSILVNQLLPTGFAGDGLRTIRHARRNPRHPFGRVLEAVAIDRLSGQLALGLITVASAPLTLKAGLVSPRTAALVAGGALAVGLTAALSFRLWRSPPRWVVAVRAFLSRAARVLFFSRRAAVHVGISLVLCCSLLFQLHLAARAIGIALDWHQVLWLGPLILLASSVPSFFGGWGVREGASAMLFASAGLGSSAGVAVSLVFGAFSLVCAMPGFMAVLFDGQRLGKRSPHPGAPSSWGLVHAAAVVIGTIMALATRIPALLTFVGSLSLLYLIVQSRRLWTPTGSFGLANTVTTLRLVLTVALLVGCQAPSSALIAGTALAILTLDGVDGWLARRNGASSDFGARYDTEVDALFVLALAFTLSERGAAGPWALLSGLWRYLYVLAPLVFPTPVGEAPRSIYYRVAYVLMVLSFVVALILPRAPALYISALGTIIISISFLHSFWRRYVSPSVPSFSAETPPPSGRL